jgi:flavin reductase (DIM6/NTAB) family NADH-FMN oxidoreductase RutF
MTAVTKPLEEGDPALDPRAFRRCAGQFATGVTIITTLTDGRPVGVTANSFSSLSMDPPLVLWSIGRSSRSFEAFQAASSFAINILSAEQIDLSQRFSSPLEDKFASLDWQTGTVGAPVLPAVVAVLECEAETRFDGGDHVILVGRVRNYRYYPGAALVYAQGRYAIAEDHPALLARCAPVAATGEAATLTRPRERSAEPCRTSS